jgi:glutathione S-transferase
MKLYFSPGACSLAPHIALHEAGLAAEYETVDVLSKATASGGNLYALNPKGTVPTLLLDDGEVLTETAVIVQYIADREPDTQLTPLAGSMARYRLQEWLNYIATELHKTFAPMFSPTTSAEIRRVQRERLDPHFEFLAKTLAERDFLLESGFTVADAYLFTILNWTIPTAVELGRWPALQAYRRRIAGRPAVRAALREEGLID